MVLPNNWQESEMILPGKNQNDSSLGWEEPGWFFLLMIGKNQKLFLIGGTKMIHTYAGKNHNDSSIRYGTLQMGRIKNYS